MSGKAFGSVKAWIAGHRAEAAGLAGAAAVTVYALHKRSQAAAGAGGGLPGGTGATDGSGVAIAGLSGTPDTSLTDAQNTLQDQLNTALGQFQQNVNDQIGAIPAGPRGPAGPPGKPAPKTPAPAPRKAPPKTQPKRTPAQPHPEFYTVRKGDTLSGIASRLHIAGGWQALFNLNRSTIKNPNLIYPNEKIRIR